MGCRLGPAALRLAPMLRSTIEIDHEMKGGDRDQRRQCCEKRELSVGKGMADIARVEKRTADLATRSLHAATTATVGMTSIATMTLVASVADQTIGTQRENAIVMDMRLSVGGQDLRRPALPLLLPRR